MLKPKLQYLDHLMRRTESFEKTLMLGKIEDRMRRGQQRMRWLDDITNWMDRSLSNSKSLWWTRKAGMLQSMALQRAGYDWATELNWYRWKVKVLVTQSCPAVCDPMDCSPPGSSVHGIHQPRMLNWVPISFSRGFFSTQELNPGLLHCRQILYHQWHQGISK